MKSKKHFLATIVAEDASIMLSFRLIKCFVCEPARHVTVAPSHVHVMCIVMSVEDGSVYRGGTS